jgi:hypothetical protein
VGGGLRRTFQKAIRRRARLHCFARGHAPSCRSHAAMKATTTFAVLSLPLLAAVFALSLTSARADVTMEMKVEGTSQNTTSITRIKGDKMRTDVGDEVTSYVDCATGDQVTVLHKTKEVTRLSGAKLRADMEEAKKEMAKLGGAAAAAAEAPRFFPTGKQEKVGPYNAAVYTRTVQGVVTTLYLAKDLPNYAALKAELAVIGKLPGQEQDAKLDGIVVKSVTDVGDAYKSTSTLVAIKQEPLDAALFVPPAGK